MVYCAMVLSGLFIISVLIGIVTDTVSATMNMLSEGKSKVVEENHTLILGWNGTTPQLLCQIAFLRRVWRAQNQTLSRRLFFWLRVKPSSPVAKNKIVIMNNQVVLAVTIASG